MYVRDFGNCGVPCFNVGTDDGRFLEEVMARAAQAGRDVRVQLSLQAESLTGLSGQNVVGIVPGTNDTENIIVNAHGDGWFDAGRRQRRRLRGSCWRWLGTSRSRSTSRRARWCS